jgi:hypothetical protein
MFSALVPIVLQKSKIEQPRKSSQKLIFGLLCDSIAFQSRQEGPWSILEEAIRSLTSPRVKRISGSKNFRSTPQKDFCNNIVPKADVARRVRHVRFVPQAVIQQKSTGGACQVLKGQGS